MSRRMKVAVAAVVALLLVGTVAFAASHTYKGFTTVRVLLNGAAVESDVPGIILDGRTLLPVRALTEALGLEVAWDNATKTASLSGELAARRPAPTGGVEIKVNNVSAETYMEAADGQETPMVAVAAQVTVVNNGTEPVDLGRMELRLRGEGMEAEVPGTLAPSADRRSTLVAPGAQALAVFVFEPQPIKAEAARMALVTGSGDTVQALTITIECTWPPLRCRVTIDLLH